MFTFLRKLLTEWFGKPVPGAVSAPFSPDTPVSAPPYEQRTDAHIVPYDETLLEKSRTQWQFGDWESLIKLDRDVLQHHPDRSKLALLAAAAHLQMNNSLIARQFVRLAKDWGCSKKHISQILIAGVHNSLGRVAILSDSQERALEHFTQAIAIGTPGNDVRLISQGRFRFQSAQIGVPERLKSLFASSLRSDTFVSDMRRWKPAERIVIVRLDNIGDQVLGSPFLSGLRRGYPNAEITMIVNKSVSDYYTHCPWIDRLIALPYRQTRQHEEIESICRLVADEIQGVFDMLINPRYAEDYYQACRLNSSIDSKRRVAFRQNRAVVDGLDANSFYNELVEMNDDTMHAVEYSYVMLNHLGVHERFRPEVWFTQNDLRSVCAKAGIDRNLAYSDISIVVVGIGASSPIKIWPRELFKELVEKLPSLLSNILICLAGLESERAAGDHIAASSEYCVNLTGMTTLCELAALCSIAHLYIGTDSGPKHIAAASGCPIVEIGHVPVGHPSRARSFDTGGACWSAVDVYARTIAPAPEYSDAQIQSGEAIASITPGQLIDCINEFISAPEFLEAFKKRSVHTVLSRDDRVIQ